MSVRLLMLLALLINGVESRPKDAPLTWKQRKRNCEINECKTVMISDPNCVYRCVSSECFRTGFEDNTLGLLEPGEIDSQRDRIFQSCATKQDAQIRKQDIDAKRAMAAGKQAKKSTDEPHKSLED